MIGTPAKSVKVAVTLNVSPMLGIVIVPSSHVEPSSTSDTFISLIPSATPTWL